MKKCRKCNKKKQLFEFEVNNRYKDNLNNVCKECRKIDRREYSKKRYRKREAFKDVQFIQITERINEIKKLPKKEKFQQYDNLLNFVASLGFSEKTDVLKNDIHLLIERL